MNEWMEEEEGQGEEGEGIGNVYNYNSLKSHFVCKNWCQNFEFNRKRGLLGFQGIFGQMEYLIKYKNYHELASEADAKSVKKANNLRRRVKIHQTRNTLGRGPRPNNRIYKGKVGKVYNTNICNVILSEKSFLFSIYK
jgi:hypothetical protein